MSTFLITLLMMINSERSTPLVLNEDLSARAQERAEYLCASKQWSHAGYVDSFKGYNGYWVGENLGKTKLDPKKKGEVSAKRLHKAFMASPKHAENILNDRYTDIGLGRSCGITVELFLGKKN